MSELNEGIVKKVLSTWKVRGTMKALYWQNDKKAAFAYLQENFESFDLEQNDHSFDEDKLIAALFEIIGYTCQYSDLDSFRLLTVHPFFDVNMVVAGNSFGTDEDTELYCNLAMLKEMVALGMDVTWRNNNGDTLLSLADRQAHRQRARLEPESEYLDRKQKAAEVVAYLSALNVKEDIYAMDEQGTTAFHRAAFEGDTEILASLLDKGFDVETSAQGSGECYDGFVYDGKNALHIACRFGLPNVVDFLLEHNAGASSVCSTGYTPLFFVLDFKWEYKAFEYGWRVYFRGQGTLCERRTAMIQKLVASGAELDTVVNGDTPLLYLLTQFNSGKIHQDEKEETQNIAISLMKLGATTNVRNYNGQTPLHFACQHGFEDLFKVLLTSGADLNAKDNNGATPLHYALWNEHPDIAAMLIKKGADGNIIANNTDTAMSIAAENGYARIVELLLAKS